MERVAVTGIGVVSPAGTNKDEFWKNCIAGKNSVSRVSRFDTSQFQTNMGGEIKQFSPYMKNTDVSSAGLCTQYALSAARMAYDDAGIVGLSSDKCAVFMGTTMGEGQELGSILLGSGEGKKRRISLFDVYNIAAAVCREFGLKCEASHIPNACSAGNFSIISAYEKIRRGKAVYAFAGGADVLSELAFKGFSKLRSLAPDKCRPFDKNRLGLIISEGAGVLFLEAMSSAKRRGAHIYAEVIGWGASCDAHSMIVPSPDANGIKAAVRQAVKTTGIEYRDVDYICAHGTGTPTNDSSEALAINSLFGEHTPVSSLKSMIGHSMGAASAIEAAACCMAIEHSVIPPTINFEEADESCKIDCVANNARCMRVRIAANNAYAFGGSNTCVLFREV